MSDKRTLHIIKKHSSSKITMNSSSSIVLRSFLCT